MSKLTIADKEWILQNSTGKTWIYSDHKSWGNNIGDWEGIVTKGRAYGHLTPLPKNGDKLQVDTKSGKKIIFYFTNVEPCGNPRDMFFADVQICPEFCEAHPEYVEN